MGQIITASRAPAACTAILLWMLLGVASAAAAEGPQHLVIVVGEKAPELERMAAEELSAMLGWTKINNEQEGV